MQPRFEPGTWATNYTLWLIYQRVLQTPFVGFMGNLSGSLACVGDRTVWFLISKEPVEFGHCIQDFNQQGQGYDRPKVMIQEAEYE